MSNPVWDKRKALADKIVDLYKTREYRQEDISKEMNIPVDIVRRVLQSYDYEHTKLKTKENVLDNQKLHLYVCYDNMDYLDKYIQ